MLIISLQNILIKRDIDKIKVYTIVKHGAGLQLPTKATRKDDSNLPVADIGKTDVIALPRARSSPFAVVPAVVPAAAPVNNAEATQEPSPCIPPPPPPLKRKKETEEKRR